MVISAHHNHNESFECFYQQYHKYGQIGLSAILLIMSVSTFKTVVILYICNFLNTSFAVMIYSPIIIFYKDYNKLTTHNLKKGKTTIYKVLHRKLTSEQLEHHALRIGGEFRCSERVSSSCFKCD
jgi:hypothetical protein